MGISILAWLSSRDPHIGPRRSRGPIWVERWYPGQYENAHVLICIYFTFENYIAHGTYFPCIISKWTCNNILQFGQIQPSIWLISTYIVLGSQATKNNGGFHYVIRGSMGLVTQYWNIRNCFWFYGSGLLLKLTDV